MSANLQPADQALYESAAQVIKSLEYPVSVYEHFCQLMDKSMSAGLKKSTHTSSSIKMYPSFVTKLPDSNDVGKYLALDLGGTNYRVLLVTFLGKKKPVSIEERTYAIPPSVMSGLGSELFAYIANTLADFLKSHEVFQEHFTLGFTFSFPCHQKGIINATLVRWTKGFTATDVVGENVASLLQQAINKTGANVKCVAVVNDTVGTLASCAMDDPHCIIGIIIGTGTNAAYVEHTSRVELAEDIDASQVVINTEWGGFGDNGELDIYRTPFDKEVDAESFQPGTQIFEKMVSGLYLGEIVRKILVRLVNAKLLFRGQMPHQLNVKDSIVTKFLTEAERDPSHLYYSTHYMLTEDLEVPVVEPLDDRIVRLACEIVCKRAAYLTGAGIAAILRRLKRSRVTIGIDGSLYKFHPKFRERMTDMIDKLKPKGVTFQLRLSGDGSGKGAAAIAAAATR